MKKNSLLIFLLFGVFLSSCETTKWIAPPYTDVNKIIQVKGGMTMGEVNNVLGISPYDIYTIREDGGTILVYNYLRVNRKLEESPMSMEETKHREAGLTRGEPWYDVNNPSKLYVYFRDGAVVSLISDIGRQDAAGLIITNNAIDLISAEKLPCYPGCGGDTDDVIEEEKASIIPFMNKNNSETRQTQSQTETNKKPSAGKVIGQVLLISLLIGGLAGLGAMVASA